MTSSVLLQLRGGPWVVAVEGPSGEWWAMARDLRLASQQASQWVPEPATSSSFTGSQLVICSVTPTETRVERWKEKVREGVWGGGVSRVYMLVFSRATAQPYQPRREPPPPPPAPPPPPPPPPPTTTNTTTTTTTTAAAATHRSPLPFLAAARNDSASCQE